MQRFKIFHRTHYSFPDSVKLGPHFLRLRPREDYELRIESSSLKITPAPQSLLWHRDVESNSVATVNFDTPTNQLLIESEIIIQQYNETPLDFLLADYAINYPFTYQPDDRTLLLPYMAYPKSKTKSLLDTWIANFWQAGEPIQTYSLMQRLADYINKNLSYRVREEPGVQTPEKTLSSGSGSCRDFATLFIEAARCLGLAARFVSGYLHVDPLPATPGATHAWAEVYLPGAGWKAFDPTIGKIAGTDHIAVAVARLPESIPPIEGSFVGTPASTLTVGVWVTKC